MKKDKKTIRQTLEEKVNFILKEKKKMFYTFRDFNCPLSGSEIYRDYIECFNNKHFTYSGKIIFNIMISKGYKYAPYSRFFSDKKVNGNKRIFFNERLAKLRFIETTRQ